MQWTGTTKQVETKSNITMQILDNLLPNIIADKDWKTEKEQVISLIQLQFPELEINIYEDSTIR
ncbi:MAG: hypothetical protein FWF72_00910 [Paludibacter sp.]|nr:hypothetical protein [Paludibacter sp.]